MRLGTVMLSVDYSAEGNKKTEFYGVLLHFCTAQPAPNIRGQKCTAASGLAYHMVVVCLGTQTMVLQRSISVAPIPHKCYRNGHCVRKCYQASKACYAESGLTP